MNYVTLTLAILILALANPAHASTTLNCQVADQGSATIEVLPVQDHSELAVLKVDMHVMTAAGSAITPAVKIHEEGLLSAYVIGQQINASGKLQTFESPIVNPDYISLQGYRNADGSFQFTLSDQNRILQLGFGLWISCR